MGPKTLPCDTPLVTSIEPNIVSFMRTLFHWNKLPVMPYDLTLFSIFGCDTESKAFWKSK